MNAHTGPWLPVMLALMLLSSAGSAYGSIKTLMMPGELIKGHAKYESNCSKCHAQFSKLKQSRLCLDCHKKVARDITRKQGYHGRITGIADGECKRCHTDHKGRSADIVRLDRETFNHKHTDFVLQGAHTIIPCASCHKQGHRYRESPSDCYSCHKKKDIHRGRLGKKCQKCHNEQRWTKARFDHDKTDFPLKGKHRKTACNSCHPREQYKKVTKICYDCHRLDDEHNNHYGHKCQDCHSAKDWKKTHFNHDKDTKYRLTGKHAKLGCEDCHHNDDIYKKKPGKLCTSCHHNDDEHRGRYGKKCQDCHNTRSWKKPRFNHDKDTDYPLHGQHKKVRCDACHQGNLYKEKLSSDCFSCHQPDDVHHGQEGKKCTRCHNERGWGKKVVFDHGLTRFPLIGLHAATPCEECHLDPAYKGAALACNRCHQADDIHKRTLGPHCEQCHNPNGWDLWRFDHDTQTDYKLTGAHKKVACIDCHKWPVKDKIHLSPTCGSCHGSDDPHQGGFGRHCERCHNTDAFDHITFIR